MILFYFFASCSKVDLLQVKPGYEKLLFFRSFFGFMVNMCLASSFLYTTYSKAMCICLCSSLFIPFLSCILLKEMPLKLDVIAILTGFVGMVLIMQPWKSVDDTQILIGKNDEWIGLLLAFVACISGAFLLTLNRQLAKTLNFRLIAFYNMLSTCLFSSVWSFLVPRENVTIYSWPLLCLILASILLIFTN